MISSPNHPSMNWVESMFQQQFVSAPTEPVKGIPTDPAQCPIKGEYHPYDNLTHAQQLEVRNRFDSGVIDNYLYLISTLNQLVARRRRSSFTTEELATLSAGVLR